MASEGGRSKLKRDTSVKDRILFFEEILEEDSVSSCSTEKKVGKTLPRKIRTPRGHTEASTTASDETQSTGHVSGERSVCGTVRKERSREHFNASKRRFAVQEILTSERTYVNMLDMLVMVRFVFSLKMLYLGLGFRLWPQVVVHLSDEIRHQKCDIMV